MAAAASEQTNAPEQLKRELTLRDLVVYGALIMAPMAPLAVFGPVFAASQGMIALTYLIGGFGMAFTAISYHEMSRSMPSAGSVFVYVTQSIGALPGFVAGWSILLDYLLGPALLAVVGAAAMNGLIPAVPGWLWVVFFVATNTIINLLGITMTALTNKITLLLSLLVLAVFVVLCIIAVAQGKGGAHWTLDPLYRRAGFSPGLVFSALAIAAPAFFGFDSISTMAEETKGDQRTVGRATLLSLGLVTALFVGQTYLIGLLSPAPSTLTDDASMNNALYVVARLVGGGVFVTVVSVSIALSAAIATGLVAQAGTARLLYAMAREGKLPRFLAKIDANSHVPRRAILLLAGLSLVIGLFFVGQIGFLASLLSVGGLTAFAMLHASVVAHYLVQLRQRTWGMHLIVPGCGIAVIVLVLAHAGRNALTIGIVWIAVGTLVGFIVNRRGASQQPVVLTED